MNGEGMYEGADAPWLPTLADLIVRQDGEQGPVTDYTKYGWKALVVPTECENVLNRMDGLGTRFEQRYCDRMIAYETWELWQIKLQERFDSVVRKYDRAYSLYSENEYAMKEVMPGRTVEFTDNTTAGGSDSRTGKTKASDTPSSAINESDVFAGSITKDEATTSYGRTDSRESSTKETVTGAVMDNLNSNIDKWRDLDTDFIGEFQDLFLKVWWY